VSPIYENRLTGAFAFCLACLSQAWRPWHEDSREDAQEDDFCGAGWGVRRVGGAAVRGHGARPTQVDPSVSSARSDRAGQARTTIRSRSCGARSRRGCVRRPPTRSTASPRPPLTPSVRSPPPSAPATSGHAGMEHDSAKCSSHAFPHIMMLWPSQGINEK